MTLEFYFTVLVQLSEHFGANLARALQTEVFLPYYITRKQDRLRTLSFLTQCYKSTILEAQEYGIPLRTFPKFNTSQGSRHIIPLETSSKSWVKLYWDYRITFHAMILFWTGIINPKNRRGNGTAYVWWLIVYRFKISAHLLRRFVDILVTCCITRIISVDNILPNDPC